MTALTKEAAAEVATLLEAYDNIIEAQQNMRKPDWTLVLSVMEADGNDSTEVPLTIEIASAALAKQQEHVERELSRHGIEIA